ncbi:MAG: LysR family transcriptional regulator [Eubacterium sp.]|nr:LysR family transcriptional regulator [Eubacterium sp.]
MNIHQLITFDTVCQSLSFTAAAEELGLSQPAVSRQISTLESEINLILFKREKNRLYLTPAGQLFLSQLRPLLNRLNRALSDAQKLERGETGSLYIGLLADQSIDPILFKTLQIMKEKNTGLNIRYYDFSALNARINSNELDLVVSLEQTPEVFYGCERFIYADEPMCLAVHENLSEKVEPILSHSTLDELAAISPLLSPDPSSFGNNAIKFMPINGEGEDYDFFSITPMVVAGLATTIVNESNHIFSHPTIKCYPLDRPHVRKAVFWVKDNPNPAVQLFLETMKSLI